MSFSSSCKRWEDKRTKLDHWISASREICGKQNEYILAHRNYKSALDEPGPTQLKLCRWRDRGVGPLSKAARRGMHESGPACTSQSNRKARRSPAWLTSVNRAARCIGCGINSSAAGDAGAKCGDLRLLFHSSVRLAGAKMSVSIRRKIKSALRVRHPIVRGMLAELLGTFVLVVSTPCSCVLISGYL
jgi:hypothetical protein